MNPSIDRSEYQKLIELLKLNNSPDACAVRIVLEDLMVIDPCDFHTQSPRGYNAEKCYLVMIHSAMLNTSLTSAALDLLKLGFDVPKGEAILDQLRERNFDILVQNFDRLFHHQWNRLPPHVQNYLASQLVISLDTVQHPYYGDLKKAQVVGGKKKASSKHHHTYGSAKFLWEGHGLTIGVRMLSKGEKWQGWVQDLVDQASHYGDPLLILADGGFWINELLWAWSQKHIGFIVRTGGGVTATPLVKELEQEVKLTGEVIITAYTIYLSKPTRQLTVQLIAWVDSTGKSYCIGVPSYFSQLPPEWLVSLYRSRFAIETGHKLWNELRPRTSSHSPQIRYSLVVTAVALYNSYSLGRTGDQLPEAPRSRNWRQLIQLVRHNPPPSHDSKSESLPKNSSQLQTPHRAVILIRSRSAPHDPSGKTPYSYLPKGCAVYQYSNPKNDLSPCMDSVKPRIRPKKSVKQLKPAHKEICTTGPLSKKFQRPTYFITIKGIISTWFRALVTLSIWINEPYSSRCLFGDNSGLILPT